MKFLANRIALSSAIESCRSIVRERTPKPALMCVKIEAGTFGGSKGVRLTATDMEMALQIVVLQVDVSKDGEALIPAQKLGEVVGSSPADTLTIECDSDAATVRDDNSSFKIMGHLVSDYPPITFPSDAFDMAIGCKEFAEMIERVACAASVVPGRYAMQGVCVERKANKLVCQATDGHRVHIATANQSVAGPDFIAVIPSKAAKTLSRLLVESGEDENVAMKVSDGRAFFRIGGGVEFSTMVLEGSFPLVDDIDAKIVPTIKCSVNRETLSASIKRASFFTSEESKGIRLTFKNDSLAISSRLPESGESTIDLKASSAGEMEIGMNPAYLSDAVNHMTNADVTLELTKPNLPIRIAVMGMKVIIMPVNLVG